MTILKKNPHLINENFEIWLPVTNSFNKSIDNQTFNVIEKKLYDKLVDQRRIKKSLNLKYFINSDSRDSEVAGIGSSLFSTLIVVVICILVSVPIAVISAIYLEELAPKTKWVNLIDININNLASIPSVVYGLLGLTVSLKLLACLVLQY